MRYHATVAMLAICGATAIHSEPAQLEPELAGVGFLVGNWASGRGVVADTGGRSTGSSSITVAAQGAVLLRRDRTNLFDANGRPSGGFEQIMMIYAEGGTLHADYADGTHVIHYASAAVIPGRSVVFSTEAQAGRPIFRLAYALVSSTRLSVTFGVIPPGATALRPIATGTLDKTP